MEGRGPFCLVVNGQNSKLELSFSWVKHVLVALLNLSEFHFSLTFTEPKKEILHSAC